jgi:prepilin-type N-terminal cleavage/methylation domain-containing protein
MSCQQTRNQTGFTIVELLIATTVFTIILIAASASLIQIGRMYNKGVISSRTQQAARTITDALTQSIQFSNGEVTTFGPVINKPVPTQVLCVGTVRYTFVLNAQQNNEVPQGQYNTPQYPRQIKHALWKDHMRDAGACQDANSSSTPNLTLDNPGGDGTNGSDLLSQGMRLTSLSVSPTSNPNLFTVKVGVIYGDNDLLTPNDTNPEGCKGSSVGGQWCATSVLYTQAWKRVE